MENSPKQPTLFFERQEDVIAFFRKILPKDKKNHCVTLKELQEVRESLQHPNKYLCDSFENRISKQKIELVEFWEMQIHYFDAQGKLIANLQ